MIIDHTPKYDFDDVLLRPQWSTNASRKNVVLHRTFHFYHSNRYHSSFPLMAANMDTTGSFAMAKTLAREFSNTCLHKHYELEELVKFYKSTEQTEEITLGKPTPIHPKYCWYSMGMSNDELDKLDSLVNQIQYVPNICIDIANGYTEKFVDFCRRVREWFHVNKPIIMAGNVCTPEMVQSLIIHGGVDIVKIGIGPGSACTTRLKTGVGFPQFSAITECASAAHGLKSGNKKLGLICADGGCRTAGDVSKAFAAGADFVMVGGMFAGTDECEGEWEDWVEEGEIKSRLKFYGMSSEHAQNKHNGGMASYKASEGRVKYVDYKGSASDVVKDIKGGVASACAYIGANCLKDMNKCAHFSVVNRTHFDQTL